MKTIFINIYGILLICALGSCHKLVEVEAPKSQLLIADLFKEQKTAESALSGLYAQVRDYGFLNGSKLSGALVFFGYFTDEFVYPQQQINSDYLFYHNNVLSNDNVIKTLWANSYKAINMANVLIETAQTSTLSQDFLNRVIGESLFIRAITHFYLTNSYGSIPYVHNSDYRENSRKQKIAQTQVYDHIIADLKQAEALLPADYPTTERIRVNQLAVKALMARVYLYQKDWQNAIIKSAEVIKQTAVYKLESDLNHVFLKGTKEAIWQLKPAEEGYATPEGSTLIINQNPLTFGFYVDSSYVQEHDSADLRRTEWIGVYTLGADNWIYCNKYKQRLSTTGVTTEYSVILRLAEQYLIRSEAYAQLEDYTNSLKDLNEVRSRSGLNDLELEDKGSIMEAIVQERRIELFAEYGHRWFDLKRWGLAEDILKPKKSNWTSKDLWWPIPLSELLANPRLEPQNPSYD
jgi:hypothetical protein